MSSELALAAADNISTAYDEYVLGRGWIGPQLVFDLLKSHIKPGQLLLDIGIGTGLCSQKFFEAGLEIYGIDGSSGMLKICREKKITSQLVMVDLTKGKFPFENIRFDFIISYGVFHILGFIESLLMEASTRLKKNGIFLFSVVEYEFTLAMEYSACSIKGIFEFPNPPSGIINFSHTDSYIKEIVSKAGLEVFNKKSVLAFYDPEEDRKVYFRIYLCRQFSISG